MLSASSNSLCLSLQNQNSNTALKKFIFVCTNIGLLHADAKKQSHHLSLYEPHYKLIRSCIRSRAERRVHLLFSWQTNVHDLVFRVLRLGIASDAVQRMSFVAAFSQSRYKTIKVFADNNKVAQVIYGSISL